MRLNRQFIFQVVMLSCGAFWFTIIALATVLLFS